DRGRHGDNKDERIARTKFLRKQISIGKRTEHHFRAFFRETNQSCDRTLGEIEKRRATACFQNEPAEDELKSYPAEHRAPRKFFPIERAKPREGDHDNQPKKADELEFHAGDGTNGAGGWASKRVAALHVYSL